MLELECISLEPTTTAKVYIFLKYKLILPVFQTDWLCTVDGGGIFLFYLYALVKDCAQDCPKAIITISDVYVGCLGQQQSEIYIFQTELNSQWQTFLPSFSQSKFSPHRGLGVIWSIHISWQLSSLISWGFKPKSSSEHSLITAGLAFHKTEPILARSSIKSTTTAVVHCVYTSLTTSFTVWCFGSKGGIVFVSTMFG